MYICEVNFVTFLFSLNLFISGSLIVYQSEGEIFPCFRNKSPCFSLCVIFPHSTL